MKKEILIILLVILAAIISTTICQYYYKPHICIDKTHLTCDSHCECDSMGCN